MLGYFPDIMKIRKWLAPQDIYERYWDLDTTFGKWNLDSAKKKMAHTKFLTVHFETGTIPPIYVLELVV